MNEFVAEHEGEMNALFGTPITPGFNSSASMSMSRKSSSFGNSMNFVDSTSSFET